MENGGHKARGNTNTGADEAGLGVSAPEAADWIHDDRSRHQDGRQADDLMGGHNQKKLNEIPVTEANRKGSLSSISGSERSRPASSDAIKHEGEEGIRRARRGWGVG